jgi:Ca2+-binding EF-hand superfamily protein
MKISIKYLAIVSCFTLSVSLGASLAHAESMGHDEPMHKGMHDDHMSGDHMGEQMEDKHFKEMDTNGDGMVSKTEFDAAHNRHFKEMDTNGDGQLSRDEMKAGHKKMMEKAKDKHFEEADANHDGVLTREEAKNMPMLSKHFDEVDANKDGKVTREEMAAAMEKMRKKHDGKQSSEQ